MNLVVAAFQNPEQLPLLQQDGKTVIRWMGIGCRWLAEIMCCSGTMQLFSTICSRSPTVGACLIVDRDLQQLSALAKLSTIGSSIGPWCFQPCAAANFRHTVLATARVVTTGPTLKGGRAAAP